MTPAEQARHQRDFAVMANFVALRLQLSRHPFDREGAQTAYQVALIHHEMARVLAGQAREVA